MALIAVDFDFCNLPSIYFIFLPGHWHLCNVQCPSCIPHFFPSFFLFFCPPHMCLSSSFFLAVSSFTLLLISNLVHWLWACSGLHLHSPSSAIRCLSHIPHPISHIPYPISHCCFWLHEIWVNSQSKAKYVDTCGQLSIMGHCICRKRKAARDRGREMCSYFIFDILFTNKLN